jgi:hypothetical protein
MKQLATLSLLLLLSSTPAPAASIFSCGFLSAVAAKLGLSSRTAESTNNVSEVERAVVQYQVGTMADLVNASLRRGTFTSPFERGDELIGDFDLSEPAVRNLIRILDSTIASSKDSGTAWDTSQDRVAWRASSFAPSRAEPDLGFLSLSQSRKFTESLKGPNKVLAVVVPKGTNVLDTQKTYSSENAFQSMEEILAPRGSYLERVNRNELSAELQQTIPENVPVYRLVIPSAKPSFAFFSVTNSSKMSANQEKFSGLKGADEILSQLKIDPVLSDMFKRQSGFVDRDTIESHTRSVAKFSAESFPTDLPSLNADVNSRKIFNLLVALHDIGKGLAADAGNRDQQYLFTLPIAESVLRGMGVSIQEREIIKSMIAAKEFSAVVRNQMTPEAAALSIRAEANRLGVDPSAYFKIRDIFYRSDMLAHPTLRMQLFVRNSPVLNSQEYQELAAHFQ